MNSMRKEISEIKDLLKDQINHSYILKFVELPALDDEKILLLHSILSKAKLTKKKLHSYIITTMLVQIALDTHENVSNSTQYDGDLDLKERQLTVLAGSYYSGLYYYLLSSLDDVEMVQALASGIKVVNEQKISVYQKESADIEHLFKNVGLIESELIQRVADFVNVPEIKRLAMELLLFKRLIFEKNRYLTLGISNVFDALKKQVFPKIESLMDDQIDYLIEIVDNHISQTKANIIKYASETNGVSNLLKERIENIINSHSFYHEKVAEEG